MYWAKDVANTKGEPSGSPFDEQISRGNDRKKSYNVVVRYLAASSAAAPDFRAAALSVASQVKASPVRPKWP